MAFQTTVSMEQGFGVPGDIHLESPSRVEPLIVNSAGNSNVFGYAYTKSATTNTAQVGGAINASNVFAGLLVNSKEAALHGGLAPSLAIPDGSIAGFATMGDVVVSVTTACNIGDRLCYNTTTGALSTIAAGASAPSGSAIVPNAVIYRYPVTSASGGLTVARLTN